MNRPILYLLFVTVTLTAAATAVAAPATPRDAADGAASGAADGDVPAAIDTVSRRVYKADDVGMIIGGASEDAKAKVQRLPVRKR